MAGDRSVDLLNLLKGPQQSNGLKVVKVSTTDPAAITLVFEGTKLALGLEIFEIPVSLYPLKVGDRLLAYPLIGQDVGQRWGLLKNINGGSVTLATMAGPSSFTIAGIGKTYSGSDVVVPVEPALTAGDVVSIAATWSANKIKYVILQKY